MRSFDLALVTGASSGIGEAFAELLADQGTALVISGRNQGRLNAVAERLRSKVEVSVVQADLSDVKERGKLVEVIKNRAPDLVVNNAGFGFYGEAVNLSTKKQMEMLEVDGAAVLELSLEGAKAMIEKGKKGVILNVSSAAAFQIFPYFAVYAAVKAFVNSFSQSFDEEVRAKGVRVLAACPGVVATRFRKRASQGKQQESDPFAMSQEFAANELWKQIQLEKPIRTFDWKYRVATFFSRYLVPNKLIAKFAKKAIKAIDK